MPFKGFLKDDLVERLQMLDMEIDLLAPNKNVYYEMTLVGGSALILINKTSRATMDIDTLTYSPDLQPLLSKYNINANVRSYLSNFPYNWMDRRVKIGIPTKRITFYSLSLEDLVVSKLFAKRPQDIDDIKSLGVMRSVDLNIIDSIVYDDEFKTDCFNDRVYNDFMYYYEQYKEDVIKWRNTH